MNMNGVKKCCRCCEIKSLEEFGKDKRRKDGLKSFCKKCHNEYNKKYPRPSSYLKDYYAKNKDRMLLWQQDYNKKRPDVRKRASKKYRMKLKLEVLSHYSDKSFDFPHCACCGETIFAFLTIDHINGGGNKHRKQLNGMNFYLWLKQHNFPEGYQVLCMNCQFGRKNNNGVCPHKEGEQIG